MDAQKNHRMKVATLALLVALAGTAAATPAHARSVPGHYGVSRSHSHCFYDHYGSIQNRSTDASCSEAKIRFPLTMDSAGRVTATIHAFAPDVDHNISCRGYGMTNGDGGDVLWNWSHLVSLDTFGAGDIISISWDAHAHGASFVECTVPPKSWINVIEW